MNDGGLFAVPAHWIALVTFFLILGAGRLGFIYKKFREKKLSGEQVSPGSLESSMLGLMALLMGFTFAMAFSKFEKRREVIIEEANDIGTAILRADLFPDSVRRLLDLDFKEYLEARISYYEAGIDLHRMDSALAKGNRCADRLWLRVAGLTRDPSAKVSYLQMIPALNSMIDIAAVRHSGIKSKVPPFILLLLLILTLMCSFMFGYGHTGKSRDPVLVCLFSLMTTIALFLILELDRPRRGILNLNAAQQQMVDLRELLKSRLAPADF